MHPLLTLNQHFDSYLSSGYRGFECDTGHNPGRVCLFKEKPVPEVNTAEQPISTRQSQHNNVSVLLVLKPNRILSLLTAFPSPSGPEDYKGPHVTQYTITLSPLMEEHNLSLNLEKKQRGGIPSPRGR